MAHVGNSLNNFFFSMNSFRFQKLESYQRRSLAPVRYAARAVRISTFSLQVPKYFEDLLPLIDVEIKSRVTFSEMASFLESRGREFKKRTARATIYFVEYILRVLVAVFRPLEVHLKSFGLTSASS